MRTVEGKHGPLCSSDPYGMDVKMGRRFEAVAATKAIDVWYLFSLSGFTGRRRAAAATSNDSKRGAITRHLGTDAWER